MLNEPRVGEQLLDNDGALRLLEAIIKLAKDDFVLDIQWLADHTGEPARMLTKRYGEVNDRMRKISNALLNARRQIEKNKEILENAESNEADLVRARGAIRENRKLIAELEAQRVTLKKEYRFLLKATAAANEIKQIEAWAEGRPEVIRTWKNFALLEYLEDLKLPAEREEELKDRLRKDKRDPWIVLREIRKDLAGSLERKKKRHRRKEGRSDERQN